MGADMMTAMAPSPFTKDGNPVKLGQELFDEMLSRVISEVAEYDDPEELNWYADENDENSDWRSDLVDSLKDTLSAICIHGGSREIDFVYPEGREYIVTGGLSWGDLPTECFNDITIIDILGVTKIPFDLPAAGK